MSGARYGQPPDAARRRTLLTIASLGLSCVACRDTVGFSFERAEAEAGTPAADGHLLSRPPKEPPPLSTASGARDALGGLDGGQEYTVTEGKGVTGKRAMQH